MKLHAISKMVRHVFLALAVQKRRPNHHELKKGSQVGNWTFPNLTLEEREEKRKTSKKEKVKTRVQIGPFIGLSD